MLQSIEIENFRCFHHSRLENFGQVNLIGGMNNAGKTALLEAILLVNEPTWDSVAFLQQMRLENTTIFEERPELAWGNFFLKQDKSAVITLKSIKKGEPFEVKITCEERSRAVSNGNGQKREGDRWIKVDDSAVISEVGFSLLSISSKLSGIYGKIEAIYDRASLADRRESPMVAQNNSPNVPHDTFLIPTGFKKPAAALARELEKAKLRDETAPVLEAFRIVDDSIAKIDSINLGEPRIYIFRKNEKPQPLNFFGDALNKIADLILRVVNNPNCILLIDEIENGIHHTNQQEFWRMLIKLAVQKNVQIFATSHSAEMIGAFQAAAVEDRQEDKVRYITLYRSARTGEIVGAQRDMETLGYNLRTNNPYRGE